ncbi:hybrid sensor histidine kinase/response regulator [Nitrospirillum viridazoti]|uniref:Chemotaxis protein CheA n=1 Tax=Nitrospirillum viridazoti CBAmc TaxID=1441467 RepID=A0A248JWU7_9PROT|nr:response regulator [Nitrospirillum amazonense]ASG22971.1 hybrid sensor histidine kinase/response regulator [Nitrospirillum amazonense CBAmc]TWB38680.1 CheA signal transduction histidine kinase [Nitrospirillum amazonense]
MSQSDDQLLKRLLAMFEVEAEEHLSAIAAGLLALEQSPPRERAQELVETTFREVHTLKGAARAVNLGAVVAVCHAMESVFAALKGGRLALTPGGMDLLHQGYARVRGLLDGSVVAGPDQDALVSALEAYAEGREPVARAAVPPEPAARTEPPAPPPAEEGSPANTPSADTPADAPRVGSRPTLRIATSKVDTLLRHAEELVSARLAAGRQVADLGGLASEVAERVRSHERARRRLEEAEDSPAARLLKQQGDTLRWLSGRIAQLANAGRQDLRILGKMLDSLLDEAKQVLMVPVSALLDPMAPLVRDLARAEGKEVELIIRGGDLEIDRRIQEEMKDALLHLVRNAIAHGIEPPEAREAKGKAPRGTLAITVAQTEAGRAEIAIADDGGGFDVTRLRHAAAEQGLMSAEAAAALDDDEARALAFRSGLSTSGLLTDVSGRGLGLPIVQEKVERLGGGLAVESTVGLGTVFRIRLPVTLASFRGVLVEVEGACFILPTGGVERVARVALGAIATVENRETVVLDGRTLGLVRLADVLGLAPTRGNQAPPSHYTVAVLSRGGQATAFIVDRVRDEQEVLMKSLGPQLARAPYVTGASVLATGEVALILNIPDLLAGAAQAPATARPMVAVSRKKSILIAEDSITARTLFKNLLEAAGYQVRTAVDGVDAWGALTGGEEFDLLVSDVEMPRMGGFELTTKVRGTPKLAELPVVLITSLGSREDKERGIDAGANAYLVKDSFDQGNLLQIVSHLV